MSQPQRKYQAEGYSLISNRNRQTSRRKRRRRRQSVEDMNTLGVLLLSFSFLLSESGRTNGENHSRMDPTVFGERRGNDNGPFHGDFIQWCRSILGIETILELQTFEYFDYMHEYLDDDHDDIMSSWDDDGFGTANGGVKQHSSLPIISVRGLAAGRAISAGEVVIRIPLRSLISVSTTIDQDPVLSSFMGAEARQKYGWDLVSQPPSDKGNYVEMEEISFLYELALLAIALLYHRSLGEKSHLAAYISMLEESPVDAMPFLWDKERFQRSPLSRYDGVRSVAQGIRRDIRDMYRSVLQILVEEHPHVFGRRLGEGEWMFSYEHFQWAFAIVNSRHWQLPIRDLDRTGIAASQPYTGSITSNTATQYSQSSGVLTEDQQPPANTPTETWVKEHVENEEELLRNDPANRIDNDESDTNLEHSFLAPVADLLNFGPPCTRGRYNEEMHSFEITASCPFRKGQEVTFWYGDECDQIMVGVYGFAHPMIRKCPSAEEYRLQAADWKRRATIAEVALERADSERIELRQELQIVDDILRSCGDRCEFEHASYIRGNTADEESSPPQLDESRRENGNVRGAERNSLVIERHGIRRMMRDSRNSEF